MTDRKPWEKTIQGTFEYHNDGNDYFYEWYELETEPPSQSLEDLIEEYLGAGFMSSTKVEIKVRKGAIFITSEGVSDGKSTSV
jgi:hypothetical protein